MAWSASAIREWATREALTGRVLTKADELAEEASLGVLKKGGTFLGSLLERNPTIWGLFWGCITFVNPHLANS